MKAIKTFLTVAAYALMAAAFAVMIGFEIHFGAAAGRYSGYGADLISMPGLFCFIIAAQAAWGGSFISRAIKILWGKPLESGQEQLSPGLGGLTIFQALDATVNVILTLLGIWAGCEISYYSYKFLVGLKMPDKAIYALMMLLIVMVFFFLIYWFGVLKFIDDSYPKLRQAFQLLRKKKTT